jgi:hypothetical protein
MKIVNRKFESKIDPSDVQYLLHALQPNNREIFDQTNSKSNLHTVEDWKRLISLAKRYSLAPLLYYQLKLSNAWTTIPDGIRDDLHREYFANALRNTNFFGRLSKILGVLTEAGIDVIPLKGIHLAELVYKNRALRTIGDADLLIKTGDIAAAGAVMRALGFTQEQTPSLEATREVEHHLPPFKKAGNFTVEIHWNIGIPYLGTVVDEQKLWKRSQKAKIAGVEVKILSPADLLLHLCFHMSVHHVFRWHLRALFDISETIERSGKELHWEVFLEGCENSTIAKGSYLALVLAEKYADAKIPDTTLKRIQPAGDCGPIMKTAEDFVLYGENSKITYSIARLWGDYPFFHKVRHFVKRIFPVRAEMETMYSVSRSSPIIYFYYIKRIVDLLKRYGKNVWLLFKRDKEMTADSGNAQKENVLRDWMK